MAPCLPSSAPQLPWIHSQICFRFFWRGGGSYRPLTQIHISITNLLGFTLHDQLITKPAGRLKKWRGGRGGLGAAPSPQKTNGKTCTISNSAGRICKELLPVGTSLWLQFLTIPPWEQLPHAQRVSPLSSTRTFYVFLDTSDSRVC